MSKSRDQIESIQPSSSDESTAVSGQLSSQSARTDNTPTSTQTTKPVLPPMLSEEKKEFTTPPTTEKTRQHALVLKVALAYLRKTGMVKRYQVLSPDGETVLRLRYEFDLSQWTPDLDLK